MLNVKIGADLRDLYTGAAKAEGSINSLAATAKAAALPFNSLATSSTQAAASLTKTSGAVAKSKTDFTGLSRVLQDSVYGFGGVANNLTAILPAAGAAGLAISAIVAAIQFSQLGLSNWTRGMGGASEAAKAHAEAVKQAKEEHEAFAKSLDDARASALASGLQLQAYVNIARDGSKPLAERNEALREANKILGEHGEKLTLVNINTKAVTEEINNFTAAMVAAAVATKFSDRIADLFLQKKTAWKEYEKAVEAVRVATAKVRDPEGAGGGRDVVDLLTELRTAQDKQNAAADKFNGLQTETKQNFRDLNEAQAEVVRLQALLGHHSKETAKHQKTQADIMKSLRGELDLIADRFEVGILSPLDKDMRRIDAFNKAIDDLFKLGFKPSDKSIIDLIFGQKPEQDRLALGKILSDLGKEPTAKQTAVALEIPIKLSPIPDFEKTADDNALKGKIDAYSKAVSQIFVNSLQSGLANVGEEIGNAISGKGFEGVFKSIFTTIGSYLQELGKHLISIAPLLELIKQTFKNPFTSTAGMIVGGVGLIAIGQLMKNIPKFADGITGFRGGLALVGERGPELMHIPRNANITPNHRLSGISGGVQVFIPEVSIRGSDIRLIFNRANDQHNRRT